MFQVVSNFGDFVTFRAARNKIKASLPALLHEKMAFECALKIHSIDVFKKLIPKSFRFC